LDFEYIGKLPHISGVYFAVDDGGCVQYVGCAVDIGQRWKGHKLRELAIQCGWRIYFKEVDKENFLSKEQEEAFFIATLRPKHNQLLKCQVHG
jgi:excinuclease UvrABC nuclease subunit